MDKIDELIDRLLECHLDLNLDTKTVFEFDAAKSALRAEFDAQAKRIEELRMVCDLLTALGDASVNKLQSELAALKEAQRWIPINEGLPKLLKPKSLRLLCYAPEYDSMEFRWLEEIGESVSHYRRLQPPEAE